MQNPHSKATIIQALKVAFTELQSVVETMVKTVFEASPVNGKWSAAEQLDHLIRSTKPVLRVLGMPKIVLRFFGKPTTPSSSYSELLNTYRATLQTGVTATKPYIPTQQHLRSRAVMLSYWKRLPDQLATKLTSWNEKDLDNYQIKHPALGKITIRELLFFTIFHTYHHLEAMKRIEKEAAA